MTADAIHADRITRAMLTIFDRDLLALDAVIAEATADTPDGLKKFVGALANAAAQYATANAGSADAAADALRQRLLYRAIQHDQ